MTKDLNADVDHVLEEWLEAIEIIEFSRDTHVRWRDFYDNHDASCERGAACEQLARQREIAGNREHHVTRIERYELVLRVLRSQAEADLPAPVSPDERERLHKIIEAADVLIDPEQHPELSREITLVLEACNGECVPPADPPAPAPEGERSKCVHCGGPNKRPATRRTLCVPRRQQLSKRTSKEP